MNKKYELGAAKKKQQLNPLLFLLGAGAGVGLWYFLKNVAKTPVVSLPAAQPSLYANLAAVATRLDELKTLYRSGRLTPEQALVAADALIPEARKFLVPEGDQVSRLVDQILKFETEIKEYIQTQQMA